MPPLRALEGAAPSSGVTADGCLLVTPSRLGPAPPSGVTSPGRSPVAPLCAAALLLLLGPACADQCARGQDVGARFALKARACGVTTGAAFDLKACQTSLASCSASELSQVDRYLDCLDALPTCSSDTPADFSAKVLACANDMLPVSAPCFVLDP